MEVYYGRIVSANAEKGNGTLSSGGSAGGKPENFCRAVGNRLGRNLPKDKNGRGEK